MGGHEDAVPALAVPGVGGVLRVVGLLRAPGERAVLAALALLQDEVAVLDREGFFCTRMTEAGRLGVRT
jgi:hypothetical protein